MQRDETGPRLRIDGAVLEVLYRRHALQLTAYFARRLEHREDALDLTAETFAQAFASRRRFRGDEEQAVMWLYGIARNLLNRHARNHRTHLRAMARLHIERRALPPDQVDALTELGMGGDQSPEVEERIRAALAALPEAQRQALRLRVIDGCEYSEVASRCGASEQAVRARVSRALRTLSADLRDVDGR